MGDLIETMMLGDHLMGLGDRGNISSGLEMKTNPGCEGMVNEEIL